MLIHSGNPCENLFSYLRDWYSLVSSPVHTLKTMQTQSIKQLSSLISKNLFNTTSHSFDELQQFFKIHN